MNSACTLRLYHSCNISMGLICEHSMYVVPLDPPNPPDPTYILIIWVLINSLRPRQNGRRFADDTFKRIFFNENVRISLKIPLKFVPKVRINNIPTLVQIMVWRRLGGKPLFEPMMVRLPTHISVTRPQWVNYISKAMKYNYLTYTGFHFISRNTSSSERRVRKSVTL